MSAVIKVKTLKKEVRAESVVKPMIPLTVARVTSKSIYLFMDLIKLQISS